MSFWDDIKKKASEAADAATKIAKDAANIATSTAAVVADAAEFTGHKISQMASNAYDAVSDVAKSSYDTVCEFSARKVKDSIRGMNLQETIDELNKYQAENGKDVSALVNFIKQLKDFSEDGSK